MRKQIKNYFQISKLVNISNAKREIDIQGRYREKCEIENNKGEKRKEMQEFGF